MMREILRRGLSPRAVGFLILGLVAVPVLVLVVMKGWLKPVLVVFGVTAGFLAVVLLMLSVSHMIEFNRWPWQDARPDDRDRHDGGLIP